MKAVVKLVKLAAGFPTSFHILLTTLLLVHVVGVVPVAVNVCPSALLDSPILLKSSPDFQSVYSYF